MSDLIHVPNPLHNPPKGFMDSTPTFQHGNILVVDDVEHNRELLGRLLMSMGHKIVAVDSGRAALDKLEEANFDLMILDIMMPEMNGFEVLEHRRTSQRLREVPVIVVSALDELESIVRCVELGAEDFLPKPINRVLLRARVEAVLEKKRLRDTERAYLLSISQQAEVALQKSEHLLQTVVSNAPIVLFALDDQGIFTLIEGLGLQLLNLTSEELVGRSVYALAEGMPSLIEGAGRAQAGETFTAVLEIGERVFESQQLPMRDASGQISGVIGVATDITERVKAKAQLQEAYDVLEIRVAERTVELSHANALLKEEIGERQRVEEDLALARDQALEASRLKSEFLATVSHEIRTPMNGIIGMTELLLETELDETQIEFANIVHHEAFALLEIINDILDFSKIEAGKLILGSMPFSLRAVFGSMRELFGPKAVEQSLGFSVKVSPAIPDVVIGDSGRLRQVLINLVGNAFKFTESGHINVVAELKERMEGQAQIFISVEDTGIGVSANAQHTLFDSFTQADGSITRRYGGTGLGLAISKRLVELMDGQIGVESTPGVGSTFWFTAVLSEADAKSEASTGHMNEKSQIRTIPSLPPLPNSTRSRLTMNLNTQPTKFEPQARATVTNLGARAEIRNETTAWAQVPAGSASISVPESETIILLVEDNAINQQLAQLQLKQLGFTCHAVSSGRAAVAEIDATPDRYTIVLMDCQMPDMDGFAATRAIRLQEAQHNGHIPIIAMTANAMQGDRERCLAAGMDDYISKPVSKQALKDALDRWLAIAKNSPKDLPVP